MSAPSAGIDFDAPPAAATVAALIGAARRAAADPDLAARPAAAAALSCLVPLAAAGWPRGRALAWLRAHLGDPGLVTLAAFAAVDPARFERALDAWWSAAQRQGRPDLERLVARLHRQWWEAAVAPWPVFSDRAVALAILRRALRWGSPSVIFSTPALAAATGLDRRTVQRAGERLLSAGIFRARQSKPGWPLRWTIREGAQFPPSLEEGGNERRHDIEVAPAVFEILAPPHDCWLSPAGADSTHAIACVLAVADAPMSTQALAVALGRRNSTASIARAAAQLHAAGVAVGRPRALALAPVDQLPDAMNRLAELKEVVGLLAQRLAEYERMRENRRQSVARHARVMADQRVAEALCARLQEHVEMPWTVSTERRADALEELVMAALDGARSLLHQTRRPLAAGPVSAEDHGFVAARALQGLAWPPEWEATRTWAVEQAQELAAAEDPAGGMVS